MGGADGKCDLVPEAIGKAIGKGLRAGLAFEAVVIADLFPHSTTLQLKITATEKKRSDIRQTMFRMPKLAKITVQEVFP